MPELFDGAGEILVWMEPGREYEFMEIMRGLGLNRQTAYNRLGKLEKYGLVETWKERQPPGRRFYRLSKKGERARELLIELYRLLES